jgi:hypothetical protein
MMTPRVVVSQQRSRVQDRRLSRCELLTGAIKGARSPHH